MAFPSKTIACRKCGEPIVFVQRPNGHWMPCDPEPVQTTLGPGVVLILEDGQILRGDAAHAQTAAMGLRPHWATCPFAEDFRRQRARQVAPST